MEWLVALNEFYIVYQPQIALKAQVPVEFTDSKQNGGMKEATNLGVECQWANQCPLQRGKNYT